MKDLLKSAGHSPRQGNNPLKNAGSLESRGSRQLLFLILRSLSGGRPISSKQSPLCLGTPGFGHSSPAPLLLLSKRHPLRWAAVWVRLRRLTLPLVGRWMVPRVRIFTDVEEAISALGELTGQSVREDVTARIFQRFCVGKQDSTGGCLPKRPRRAMLEAGGEAMDAQKTGALI